MSDRFLTNYSSRLPDDVLRKVLVAVDRLRHSAVNRIKRAWRRYVLRFYEREMWFARITSFDLGAFRAPQAPDTFMDRYVFKQWPFNIWEPALTGGPTLYFWALDRFGATLARLPRNMLSDFQRPSFDMFLAMLERPDGTY